MAGDNARPNLVSILALALIAAVVGLVLSAPAGAKKKKPPNTTVSAYCTLLGEPLSSYAPCTKTGRSVFTVDDQPNGNGAGEYNSIAIGTDGKPVISYRDFLAQSVKVAKCNDIECRTKATISTVDDPANGDNVGIETSLAVGVDGKPVISYYDATNLALKVAACANTKCTGVATITTVDDPANDVGSWSEIAIGADGIPIIAYFDQTAQALKVAKCTNAQCTGSATITTVDDPAINAVGITPSIAVGVDGFAVISYLDGTASALKIAKCVNAACTGVSTITVVDDPTDQVGAASSIAVPRDGDPVIAYQDATAHSIKVAKCANPSCTGTAIINVLDDPADDLNQLSLALGAGGVPIVAYGDLTAQTLKMATCSDAACAAPAAIITVDAPIGRDVSNSMSVTVGTDLRPVLSYYSTTNTEGDLKVARVAA